jgi:hypothetical protein
MDILDFQNDMVLKSHTTHHTFWNLGDKEILPSSKSVAHNINPMLFHLLVMTDFSHDPYTANIVFRHPTALVYLIARAPVYIYIK